MTWENHSKKLELVACLEDESEFYSIDGQATSIDLANSFLVGMLSPKNQWYSFVLVLYQASPNPQLHFIGLDKRDKQWIHIDKMWPFENEATIQENLTTTFHWHNEKPGQNSGKILQISNPTHGVHLFRCQLTENGNIIFRPKGAITPGQALDEQWIFQAAPDAHSNRKRHAWAAQNNLVGEGDIHLF